VFWERFNPLSTLRFRFCYALSKILVFESDSRWCVFLHFCIATVAASRHRSSCARRRHPGAEPIKAAADGCRLVIARRSGNDWCEPSCCYRRPRGSGGPAPQRVRWRPWMPAYAGMTREGRNQMSALDARFAAIGWQGPGIRSKRVAGSGLGRSTTWSRVSLQICCRSSKASTSLANTGCRMAPKNDRPGARPGRPPPDFRNARPGGRPSGAPPLAREGGVGAGGSWLSPGQCPARRRPNRPPGSIALEKPARMPHTGTAMLNLCPNDLRACRAGRRRPALTG
jgi:hypothetical protein